MTRPVTLGVGGTWHAPRLAAELTRHELLESVVTTVPPQRFMQTLDGGRLPVRWRPLPEVLGARGLGRVASFRTRSRYWHAVAFDRMLDRYLRSRDPRLVVIFATFGASTMASLRRRGITTVLERGSMHSTVRREILTAEHDRLGLDAPPFDRRMEDREIAEYDIADVIAIPSRSARQSFESKGIDASKLVEIPYGVDTERFMPGPTHPSSAKVLTVGNLGVEKGTHILFDAMSRLDPASIELVCVGPMDTYCRSLLATTRARITWAGPAPRASMPDVYRSASAFCLPSLQEGMSMAVLEALASGLPSLVSDRAGFGGVMTDGVEGFIHRAGSAEELAAHLTRITAHDARREMGAASRRLALRYRWSTYGDAIAEAYRSLIDARIDGA